MKIIEDLKNYDNFIKSKKEQIDKINEELTNINKEKKLLVMSYIKEWLISKSRYFIQNNITITYEEYKIIITGLPNTKEDINQFTIEVNIGNDWIYIVSVNKDCRYWEKSCHTSRLYYFKQINNVLFYLTKTLNARINYRKQRIENELYQKYRERFINKY